MLKDLLIGSTVEFDPSLSEIGPLRTAEFLGFEIFGKYQKTKMGMFLSMKLEKFAIIGGCEKL
uniref:Uncharacterized protein n=1 Tax=Salix viminalis TaxID=40686 RepID=A0A6N2MXA1_SALVM